MKPYLKLLAVLSMLLIALNSYVVFANPFDPGPDPTREDLESYYRPTPEQEWTKRFVFACIVGFIVFTAMRHEYKSREKKMSEEISYYRLINEQMKNKSQEQSALGDKQFQSNKNLIKSNDSINRKCVFIFNLTELHCKKCNCSWVYKDIKDVQILTQTDYCIQCGFPLIKTQYNQYSFPISNEKIEAKSNTNSKYEDDLPF